MGHISRRQLVGKDEYGLRWGPDGNPASLDNHHIELVREGEPPRCEECGLSTWVELGGRGGGAYGAYHPNIDAMPGEDVDIVHDLTQGIPLHAAHAHRLKAIHLLQHFNQFEIPVFLRDCYRVLRPGGSLYLMVGDLRWVFEQILKEGFMHEWCECIWGEQRNAFDYHVWGFDQLSLRHLLEGAGFIRFVDHGHYNPWEFRLEAFKP